MKWYSVGLLVVVACASPPREYRQGVPVAPRPSTFNPIMDAPHTIGQPGHVERQREYPKSPYARVLPQTPESKKEDGLWAARSPDSYNGFELMGTLLPLPDNANDSEKQIVRGCVALSVEGIGRTLGFEERKKAIRYLEKIPGKEYPCIAARAYLSCVERLILNQEAKKAREGANDSTTDNELARLQKTAKKFENRSCSMSLSKNTSDLTKGVAEWFRKGLSQQMQ